jgi:hypothetical protein
MPEPRILQRPAFLDSVIRFLVWSSVIGMLAVPALLILHFNSQIIVTFPAFRDSDGFGAVVNRLLAPSTPGSGIATGDGSGRAQIARLKSFLARPEMASGAAHRLNFVALAFDDKPEPTPASTTQTRHAVDRDGYRRMSLDLGQLPKEAVVVIADQPIRWTVTGTDSAWGRIGFEGLAPFDIANGRAGMVAGFRIAAFGARDTARATDPFHADPQRRRNLCSALRLWAEHFGLGAGQITFALVTDATAIGSSNGAITSDGRLGVTWTGPTIQSMCKR